MLRLINMNVLGLLVPHFFVKEPIPEITNPGLIAAIEEIKQTNTVEEAMQKALDMLSAKYTSKRFETYLLWPRVYEKDPNKLWEKSGFLHCMHQNYLFRILMVKSGTLKDEDITFGHSFVWYISPHQFLKVHLPDKTVAIDTWNYQFGAKMGEYAEGFGTKTL